jgi:polysaccharide export outer membrane protein
VIEVLALSGGIVEDGKAYKVKLIRNQDNEKPKVYLMDLSKIEGLAAGNSVVLAHDIIYVEPVPQITNEFVKDIAPLVTLITSTLILFLVVTN